MDKTQVASGPKSRRLSAMAFTVVLVRLFSSWQESYSLDTRTSSSFQETNPVKQPPQSLQPLQQQQCRRQTTLVGVDFNITQSVDEQDLGISVSGECDQRQPISPTPDHEYRIPAIVLPNELDVACTRSMYCNTSICKSTTLHEPHANYRQRAIQDAIFNSTSRLEIQYWGDSISAQLECDMRQWRRDYIYNQQRKKNANRSPRVKIVHFKYRPIGCPWYCQPNMHAANSHAKRADVIIWNVGAHYEHSGRMKSEGMITNIFQGNLSKFEWIVTFHEECLAKTIQQGGLVLIRSPTASHFPTKDGLWNNVMSFTECTRTPIAKSNTPKIIVQQDRMLRAMANRINATYVDLYDLSNEPSQHSQNGVDCKHFCQNCGMYRAWNFRIASLIHAWLVEKGRI